MTKERIADEFQVPMKLLNDPIFAEVDFEILYQRWKRSYFLVHDLYLQKDPDLSYLKYVSGPVFYVPPPEYVPLTDYYDPVIYELWQLVALVGDINIVKACLENHPEWLSQTDNRNRTWLHWAALSGSLPVVRYLLEDKGLNPEQIDHSLPVKARHRINNYFGSNAYVPARESGIPHHHGGRDALHYAALSGVSVVVYYFIGCGIDPAGCDFSGLNTLAYAAVSGNPDLMEALVDQFEQDPTATFGFQEQTLIHYAAISGRPEAVNWLVDRGVNPKARDKLNRSALTYAAWYGNRKMMLECVFRWGIAPLKSSKKGSVAREQVLPDTVKALADHFADYGERYGYHRGLLRRPLDRVSERRQGKRVDVVILERLDRVMPIVQAVIKERIKEFPEAFQSIHTDILRMAQLFPASENSTWVNIADIRIAINYIAYCRALIGELTKRGPVCDRILNLNLINEKSVKRLLDTHYEVRAVREEDAKEAPHLVAEDLRLFAGVRGREQLRGNAGKLGIPLEELPNGYKFS